MKTLSAALAAIALAASLSACSGPSREQPASEGSLLNPVCMPDGSVVTHQLANADGSFGDPRASFANCPWNKSK